MPPPMKMQILNLRSSFKKLRVLPMSPSEANPWTKPTSTFQELWPPSSISIKPRLNKKREKQTPRSNPANLTVINCMATPAPVIQETLSESYNTSETGASWVTSNEPAVTLTEEVAPQREIKTSRSTVVNDRKPKLVFNLRRSLTVPLWTWLQSIREKQR